MESSQKCPTRLIPVTRWSEYHIWPPIGGLRHLVFFGDRTGFSTCVVRVGKRVLIDEEKALAYFRNNGKSI